jgi:cold shock CspA family protein
LAFNTADAIFQIDRNFLEVSAMLQKTGVVKHYSPERGFGWITPANENEPEIFFHRDYVWSSSSEDLTGQTVLYIPSNRSDGKPFARQIRILSNDVLRSLRYGETILGQVVRSKDGFGFLQPLDGGSDVFFHVTSVTDREKLTEGQTFYFKVIETEKGLAAVSIYPVPENQLGTLKEVSVSA